MEPTSPVGNMSPKQMMMANCARSRVRLLAGWPEWRKNWKTVDSFPSIRNMPCCGWIFSKNLVLSAISNAGLGARSSLEMAKIALIHFKRSGENQSQAIQDRHTIATVTPASTPLNSDTRRAKKTLQETPAVSFDTALPLCGGLVV